MKSYSVAKRLYMLMVYGFLYIPIIILIIYSFNSSMYSASVWEGFTLNWYKKLFTNSPLLASVGNSLLLAASSATIATVIGTLGAVGFFRFRFTGKNFLYVLIYIVMMSPDIVMGISLLVLFIALNIPLGFWTLTITHITFSLPFVVITLFTRLSGFDKHIVEAAKDLGADEFRTFLHIIFPMLTPAVAAGWLLSFTISMDDAIGSFFVTGPDFEILPLRIYSMVRLGVKPEINALSTLIFLLSLTLVIISRLLMKEKKDPDM
ncbi:MAG: spermidine/putrescine ABC transporter permease PotC [Deferribacteraceae bacterium]|jgi:spermidine/putrescine transport system permease protein|nr:spermidine/putrescine ABC transporter permease PotC [Deferribacteraceae bacterium]